MTSYFNEDVIKIQKMKPETFFLRFLKVYNQVHNITKNIPPGPSVFINHVELIPGNADQWPIYVDVTSNKFDVTLTSY